MKQIHNTLELEKRHKELLKLRQKQEQQCKVRTFRNFINQKQGIKGKERVWNFFYF